MKRYPLKLRYIAKSAIWGGTRLKEQWGKEIEGDIIAETWELTVRPKEMAVIQNGDASGRTLEEQIAAWGGDCVAPSYRVGDRFPMLVKLIDAADRLSVQVHPDDSYALRVENDSGKTEMWYIVDAEPGASIIYGLAEDIGREEFARAVAEKRIDGAMNTCPVKAGESYFIPAGMLHAIGAGILIAEIQQNSDLTYRVYDYERRQADGSLRPLHTEKALEVVRPFAEAEVDALRFERGKGGDELLANSRYFKVRRHVLKDERIELSRNKDSFTSLLCVEGEGVLCHDGTEYSLGRGDSYFIPAGMGAYTLCGRMTVLCSEL
ncbi:MAG: class I mannose-6-phosphate isomerase [Ruminococcaceae bacterium]|nr:class I mannose-6-phosphate isomerase [Oscillospiraceae bacterium]